MSEYPGDWPLSDGRTVRLITKDELLRWQDVEPGKVLTTIAGKEVAAKDMDDDDRYGFIAAGFVIGRIR
jgi:hypothetical protein